MLSGKVYYKLDSTKISFGRRSDKPKPEIILGDVMIK